MWKKRSAVCEKGRNRQLGCLSPGEDERWWTVKVEEEERIIKEKDWIWNIIHSSYQIIVITWRETATKDQVVKRWQTKPTTTNDLNGHTSRHSHTCAGHLVSQLILHQNWISPTIAKRLSTTAIIVMINWSDILLPYGVRSCTKSLCFGCNLTSTYLL